MSRRDTRQHLGHWGEEVATRFLRRRGYRILARNLRVPGLGEVDILAQDGDTLVIVEVRTRRGGPRFAAEDSVGPRKHARLAQLAQAIALARAWEGPLRVDLVTVAVSPQGRLQHVHLWQDVVTG